MTFNKLKVLCCLTIAAETLALSDGCDTAVFIQSLVKEIIYTTRPDHVNIQAFTDNQSLHDAVKTTNLILERHLQVEVSVLREMYNKNEIKVNWIKNQDQISD